jgi:hypothetical protein
MLSIGAASKKRLATEGAGVNRPKKKAKPKRPRGTKFINFTCELDTDNCVHDENGLCIAHNTSNGNTKVGYLVNAVDAQLTCGSKEKVKFNCDVCLHVFPIRLQDVTEGRWCGMCSNQWKHCGVETCTFCVGRSLESYTGLTLNDKKKADCTVKKADLRLPISSNKKVDFKCDICLHVFSMKLYNVTNHDQWCGTCKNKTELMVLNFLQDEMKIVVVPQYIPGGMKQMKRNYGKFGKLDYHIPNSDFIWELDGAQHNMEVARFGNTTLFHRMILDKWKEYLVKKEKLKVIRFDQVAIWQNKYDWKQEMENILTFTSDKLRRQLKTTKKRYKMYAKQHNDKSKRRSIPEKVKRSHKKAHTPLGAMFTIMSFITKYK